MVWVKNMDFDFMASFVCRYVSR